MGGKNKLTAKKYYRLPDIAKRWECSVDDLLDYAEQGLLTIVAEPLNEQLECINPAFDGKYIEGWMLDSDMFPVNGDAIKNFRSGISQRQDGAFPFVVFFNHGSGEIGLDKPDGLSGLRFYRGHFLEERLVITHEEKERFERDSMQVSQKQDTNNCPIKRKNPLTMFLWNFIEKLPEEKKTTANEVYEELCSNKLLVEKTDLDKCIKQINRNNIITNDDKFVGKPAVIKRINRLLQKNK